MQRKRIICPHISVAEAEQTLLTSFPPSCSTLSLPGSPASPYLTLAGHGGDFSHAWILILILILVGIMIGMSSATCQTTGACPHVRMAAAAPQSSAGGS